MSFISVLLTIAMTMRKGLSGSVVSAALVLAVLMLLLLLQPYNCGGSSSGGISSSSSSNNINLSGDPDYPPLSSSPSSSGSKRFANEWLDRLLRETIQLINNNDPVSLTSAKEMLAKAIDIFPSREDPYQLYGVIHVIENEPRKAIPLFQKALDVGGWKNIHHMCNMMEAYRRLGDLDSARLVGLRGVDTEPTNPDILTAIALIEVGR